MGVFVMEQGNTDIGGKVRADVDVAGVQADHGAGVHVQIVGRRESGRCERQTGGKHRRVVGKIMDHGQGEIGLRKPSSRWDRDAILIYRRSGRRGQKEKQEGTGAVHALSYNWVITNWQDLIMPGS